MITQNLLSQVACYVTNIFNSNLPDTFYFHNLAHTLDVVNAVKEIGMNCGLDEHELGIVEMAAWFHDTGYSKIYCGHEDCSITICFNYLLEQGLDQLTIIKIIACIASTKYPQKPQNLFEKIICDADMYHLSSDDYTRYSSKLKQEWEEHLGLHFSDEEWNEKNKNFLLNHEYFTAYGKAFFESGKKQNLMHIMDRCEIPL